MTATIGLKANALSRIGHAATVYARQDAATEAAKTEARADFIAAGYMTEAKRKPIETRFKACYMAARCNPGLELTEEMIREGARLCSAGHAESSKPDRRTPAQDTFYGAARTALSRLKWACLGKPESNRVPAPAEVPADDDTEASDAPATVAALPVFTSAGDAMAWLMDQASFVRAVVDKNAITVPAVGKSALLDYTRALKAWQPAD